MEQQIMNDAVAGPITESSTAEQRLDRIRAVCENPTYRGTMTVRQQQTFLDALRRLTFYPKPERVKSARPQRKPKKGSK